MNRPTRLTLIGGVICITLAPLFSCDAKADKALDIANNFSHENLICGAYSLFVHQCLKNKDPNDKLAVNYFTLGDNFVKRGIDMGKAAGVSEKALSAKMDIAIEDMKLETENDCINISVLYKKHARSCKALYEDGPAKFSADLKKAGVK